MAKKLSVITKIALIFCTSVIVVSCSKNTTDETPASIIGEWKSVYEIEWDVPNGGSVSHDTIPDTDATVDFRTDGKVYTTYHPYYAGFNDTSEYVIKGDSITISSTSSSDTYGIQTLTANSLSLHSAQITSSGRWDLWMNYKR